jgi:predicted peptidase
MDRDLPLWKNEEETQQVYVEVKDLSHRELSSRTPPTSLDGLPKGILFPWKGQVLPVRLFLPLKPPVDHMGSVGRYPVLVFLHGGTDGPFHLNNQGGLAKLLAENSTFAAQFPFIAILPCTQCDRDGRMAPFEVDVYEGGELTLGQLGWTPRNLARIDALIKIVLTELNGDSHRVMLSGQSYGGRGVFWYAAARSSLFAALVPICTSTGPTPRVMQSLCCPDGKQSCCPPIWQFVGANDHRMIVDYNDEWAAALRTQKQRGQTPLYTRYENAPSPPSAPHMHGHGAAELALREPKLWEWLLQQYCANCNEATGVPKRDFPATEAPRLISGPSKLPEEDEGFRMRRATPRPAYL